LDPKTLRKREAYRRWYAANKEWVKEYNARTWPLYKKQQYYLRHYGLTKEDYERMLVEQAGICAICELPDPSGKALAVDHNHVTNEVRGLLCENCNRAIGLLKDSAYRCARAAEYLNKYAYK
jgi:hypothetical protein